ncbi:MAG: alpha/beta fold hydrolase [Candidatus Freyarchaeota archaeon]|nr:alpha/beta fold hydrolase [Candidatus Jordarchaeia archaeon]MBS7269301.1 alpha/beta fold hydrolase [Candidatus Jordarchaeia archaeon]MBS7280082.1 alpha/beta fold hydrolase [Candidatus Jordarchaeia archaeon]
MKAKVEDFEMYYEDVGKGPALVLIHGMGGDSTEWSPLIPELSREVRCIAVDLRGHGKSEKPNQPYTQDMFADDVAALLDTLKIDKAYICGVSMGGFVALKMALNHPEKVNGLILIDTAARIPPKSIEAGARWAKAFAEKGLEGYIEAEIKDIFHPMFVRRHKDAVKRFADSMRTRDPTTVSRIQQGYMKSPPALENEIKKIKVPTLIIHGREDEVVPVEEAEFIHKQIPNSQIAIIPFAGHAALLEREDFFIDAILYFIEENEKKTKKA